MEIKNLLCKYTFGISLVVATMLNMPAAFGQKANTWEAPESANSLKNPLKSDPTVLAEGKNLYLSMCSVCHGESGKGNGAASVTLDPHPANFLSIRVENESDGAIFWKLTEGNPPMASYKTLLTEDQRWKLVAYIRSLEKK
jgi:mono/diheme cytochrome c family protein